MRLIKFVKLTGYASLTNFESEVHAMTGNRNQVNLLKLAWQFVKSHQMILFLAGFSYFEPLCSTQWQQRLDRGAVHYQ